MTVRRRPERERTRGQMLVIFALAIFVAIGFVAFVVDISWYWAQSLRVQRAADAAALAGVVYLPGNVPLAVSTAKAAAAANGFTDGTGGVVVTPSQDVSDDRRMAVTVQAPVGTFFMRLFGIATVQSEKRAKAEFILAVPMGSPQNYYGVDELRRAVGRDLVVPDAEGSPGRSPRRAHGARSSPRAGNTRTATHSAPRTTASRAGPTPTTTPTGTRTGS